MTLEQSNAKKTRPEVDNFVYAKMGRRYYKIREFTGFPSNGVWLVTSKGCSSTCVIRDIDEKKLAEIPKPFVEKRMALELRKRDVIDAMSEARKKRPPNIGINDNDLVDAIFDVLSGIDKHGSGND